jgi:hypothetical protein
MPRRKAVDDGHEANRNAAAGGAAPAGGAGGLQRVSDVQTSEARNEAAGLAFLDILYREDGWLRVVGGELNKACYWKFKFSSGQHKGKYVMYVSQPGCWEEGICGLADKLLAVDQGRLRPAHDTFYDPR